MKACSIVVLNTVKQINHFRRIAALKYVVNILLMRNLGSFKI